ncbi:MAG TPA: hypothetical protein VFG14_04870 [Chthoniobacteraceae bacterium]|nr:hypothetical protein [Chthoniobacteraceae bacterium]
MQFTTTADVLNPADGSGTMLPTVLRGSAPLPAVTRADSKLMHHIAALMHSSTRSSDGMTAILLPGSLFLKAPGVIVYATTAHKPVSLGEIEVLAITTGQPVILLRRAADASPSELTADIALPDYADRKWFLDYRLFRGLAGDSWLVSLGTGPSIHLMQRGLFLTEHPPYADDWDRGAGIDRASAHLASHRIGGWSW